MSTVGQIERATQNRVVKLLHEQLGYTYLGNWEERPNNSNIEETYLRLFLKRQGYNDTLISRALRELNKVAGDQTRAFTISTRRSMDCCATVSRSSLMWVKIPRPSG